MDDSQPKAKFLVLNHAISAAFKDRLLGCVVNDVIDPANGLQPDFEPPDDDTYADYQRLQATMKGYLMENTDPSMQDDKKDFLNQVNLKNLLTEKIVEGDAAVEGSLTKLLQAHYSSKEKRTFDIQAATGKRYHLHNATFKFKKQLWTNKYYRDRINDVIEQKRDDGSLETLNKYYRKYGTTKSPRHKCEVVILPMVVGILTCEEVKVNILNSSQHDGGASATIPVDAITGVPTNNTMDVKMSVAAGSGQSGRVVETIPDEVIVAIAYDLIAISTGRPDPADSTPAAHSADSRGFFSRVFNIGPSAPHFCQACQDNKDPYPAAWRQAPIRTNNSRGVNIGLGGSNSTSGHSTPMAPASPNTRHPQNNHLVALSATSASDFDSIEDASILENDPIDLATVPIELYVDQSDHYILAENLYPGVSPSSTGSTVRSTASRVAGQTETETQTEAAEEVTARAESLDLNRE